MKVLFTLLLLMVGSCGGGGGGVSPQMTAEAYCATFPANAYGNLFYCGTAQVNYWLTDFPDGSHGYCMGANENLSGVGYSVTLYSGTGVYPVMSQSNASNLSRLLGSQSGGYIRCTRQE